LKRIFHKGIFFEPGQQYKYLTFVASHTSTVADISAFFGAVFIKNLKNTLFGVLEMVIRPCYLYAIKIKLDSGFFYPNPLAIKSKLYLTALITLLPTLTKRLCWLLFFHDTVFVRHWP